MGQISYPLVNEASLGNYFLTESHKLAVFAKTALAAKPTNLYWVKMLLFWPSAAALLATFQTNKIFETWVFAIDVLNFFADSVQPVFR